MDREGTEIEYLGYRQSCSVQDLMTLLFEYFDELDDDSIKLFFNGKERILKNVVQDIVSSSASSS